MKLITKLKTYMLMAVLIISVTLFQNVITTYAAESNTIDYFVNMPKTITLDSEKQAEYSIAVSGSIPDFKRVYVSPIDGINDTENLDFYMINQASEDQKDNVPAIITQNKFYWNHEEVSGAYEESNNNITASGLSAGTWKGIFYIEISLVDDPNHEHSYTSEITKEPTCTEEGERTYTCKCGDTYTEKIPAIGHSYDDEDDVCIKCGELNPDHKHSYTSTVTKEPTCTEEGERTYTCKCGDTYTEKIPATGHSYGEDDVCIKCGELNPDHKHNYTSIVTKEPTCTEDGERTYTCMCGETYTEKIPATGEHGYTGTITKQPTCTEDGERTYTCKCGDSYTEKIPAMEHSYTSEITKQPTCTEEGERTYTCDHCGHTYTETIPATGHSFVDGECGHCGEQYHEFYPYWFPSPFSKTRAYASIYTTNNTTATTSSDSLTITIPSWFKDTITYKYDWSLYASSYAQVGTLSCTGGSMSTTGSKSGTGTLTLTGGSKKTLSCNVRGAGKGVNSPACDMSATITCPSMDPYLDKTKHKCFDCGLMEEHSTKETDSTKDTYYFCDKCGIQFRHRCKFDDSDITIAECEGGYIDLKCVDDYYNTTHDLFTACGETSSVYFNGLGHDWKPWIVQVDPQITINPNSSNNEYTFKRTTGSKYDIYTGNIAVYDKWTTCNMSIEITLPDDFSGTYELPISCEINSSAFVIAGYRMSVSGAISYDLDYSSNSVGSTSRSTNYKLHAGKNTISFTLGAYTNNSSWSKGQIAGSVSFKIPHMPFYIFEGNEVHKCDRCKVEESHTDKLHVMDRKESTCISDGYIRYICDDCGLTYDEILAKHPNEHTDKNGDYICDDCGKDLKTCEEFGHSVEHIQKTYTINVSRTMTGKWYEREEGGYHQIDLTAGTAWSSQTLTITYDVPSDFPGEYLDQNDHYIIVYNGENGGKWSYRSSGGHSGGPYMDTKFAPITFKAGKCEFTVTALSLNTVVGAGTSIVIHVPSKLDIYRDIYHCTRCGRTETYDFSSEASTQFLNGYEVNSDGDTVYADDPSLSYEDIVATKEDETLSDNTETSSEDEMDDTIPDIKKPTVSKEDVTLENETDHEINTSDEDVDKT